MKTILAILALSIVASAQITISPLNFQAAKKASDQVTITNGSTTPVAVTWDARALGFVDGKSTVLPLGKDVTVKIHPSSARVEPNQAYAWDYDVKCTYCAVILVASVSPIEKKVKATDEGDVHAGLVVRTGVGEVVYVCPKLKESGVSCRDHFKNMWTADSK